MKELEPMRTEGKTGDFASGKVWKQVLNLALPLTLAEIVQLLYNIVDRIYLGHLPGADSLPLTTVRCRTSVSLSR